MTLVKLLINYLQHKHDVVNPFRLLVFWSFRFPVPCPPLLPHLALFYIPLATVVVIVVVSGIFALPVDGVVVYVALRIISR